MHMWVEDVNGVEDVKKTSYGKCTIVAFHAPRIKEKQKSFGGI